ncbi:MAG TPA: response regulator [Planctomycetaceae bacterium]|nr:response regulator [Planctomycetaceae bacterium]
MVKILLIEDVASHQHLICHCLRAHDYEVVVAADGRSGLCEAQQSADEIELILLDIKLPEMDGWDLAEQLKANVRTRHIPIIAVTAYAMPADGQQAIAAGCDDYTSKPIDFCELVDKVRTWTAHVRPRELPAAV